jgi:transcriptional regulator with XRE-family HTH domain
MTPAQCLAARNLLNWSQSYLARRSSITIVPVRNFEAGKTTPQLASLTAMKAALEAGGVEFIVEKGGGAGVRLRKGSAHG